MNTKTNLPAVDRAVDRASGSSFGTRRAFTLIELLVVIGILAALMAILFPLVSKIRESAREADTRALLASIEGACQSYFQDFSAYPGPLSGSYLMADDQTSANSAFGNSAIFSLGASATELNGGRLQSNGTVTGPRITGNENAVLGLLGGLVINRQQDRLEFDPAQVGRGANSLNRVRPAGGRAYIQADNLSTGLFEDWQRNQIPNASKDSEIPEFVDRWPSPMPFLILRARKGGKADTTGGSTLGEKNNHVVVNVPLDSTGDAHNGQYHLAEITPYTQSAIGANPDLGVARGLLPKDYKGAAFNQNLPHGLTGLPNLGTAVQSGVPLINGKVKYPFDAYGYLTDNSSDDQSISAGNDRLKKHRARKVDGIIIISAGKDRVYGTLDDITNFGSVVP